MRLRRSFPPQATHAMVELGAFKFPRYSAARLPMQCYIAQQLELTLSSSPARALASQLVP